MSHKSKVIDLSIKRQERDWQRIMPLLEFLEKTLNSIPPTAEELAEEDAIEAQLKAMECILRAKLLLHRALEMPGAGTATGIDARIKNLLQTDSEIIFNSDSEFWVAHKNEFARMNNRQRRAFYKKNKNEREGRNKK